MSVPSPATPGASGAHRATPSAPTCWAASAWPTPPTRPVNWCPGLGTVLANEEVTADGRRSERGNFPSSSPKLRQWNMRITAYADRLLDDLDELDWPEAIKLQQRNWIGRLEGARVAFPVDGENIAVFTTRQDTLFGATYMVLAPEHPLVEKFTPAAWPEGTHDVWTGGHATPTEAVAAYRAQAASKSDVERQAEAKRQDRRLHRRLRDQPGQRRAGPRLHRRLRADGLRHRRDHGRPGGRPARLRVRPRLRAADPLHRRAHRRPGHRPGHVGRRPSGRTTRRS